MVNSEPVRGFVAAPFTPMHPDGRVNLDLIPAYVDHLADSGVTGVFVNGTTGEGYTLTLDERRTAAEGWIRHASGRLRVIVHVGAESPAEAKELAAHAQARGAEAIGAMSPVFYKPGLEGLVTWCADLASAAPDLPFYFYHIPSMTGLYVPIVEFLSLAGDRIATLRGVKYTHWDLMDYRLCASLDNGRFDLLFGRDEVLLSALALGCEGMVGSTYNYAMPLYHDVMEQFRAGRLEEAARAQERSMRLVKILERNGGGAAAGKALMRGVGLDLGGCRTPGGSLGEAAVEAAVAEARALGTYG